MNTRSRGLLAVVMLMGLMVVLGGCEDEAGGATCSADDDCSVRGEICQGGACLIQTCNSLDECGSNRGCLVESGSLSGVCAQRECLNDSECASFGAGFVCRGLLCVELSSCNSNEDCAPVGKVCNSFQRQCVDPPAACSSDTDCVFPGTCDTSSGVCTSGCNSDAQCPEAQYCDVLPGECKAGCRVGSCGVETCDTATRTCGGTGGCTVSDCAAQGMACDASTGQCAARSGLGLCSPCTTDEECGGPGDRCARFGGGDQCTYACDTATDCPSGYQCANVTSTAKACVPDNFKCEGCLLDGCTGTDICNPTTSACQSKTDLCRACSDAVECGPGNSCESYGGQNRCLAACGTACPQDYVCNQGSGFCEPFSGNCSSCALDPTTCGARKLNDELCQCVDCLGDVDCVGGLCAEGVGDCVSSGTQKCSNDGDCAAGICHGEAPGARGVCVECGTNSDCGPGNSCVNFTCQAGGGCNPACGGTDVCQNGVCVPNTNCNPACGAGLICSGGTCIPDTGGGCSPACAAGEVCIDPTLGICTCDQTGVCPAGQTCLFAFCI